MWKLSVANQQIISVRFLKHGKIKIEYLGSTGIFSRQQREKNTALYALFDLKENTFYIK